MSIVSHETHDVRVSSTRKDELVSRVVFPGDMDLDALPMYIDGGRLGDDSPIPASVVTSRTTAVIPAGDWISFGSYFNSFPAGYWNRWTTAQSVSLKVQASGQGTLLVYRSNARGDVQQLSSHAIAGDTTVDVELQLQRFGDGGHYWFEVAATNQPVSINSAGWYVADNGKKRPSVTLAICTYNRPDYCVATLNQVADSADVLDVVDEIVIVDQGTDKVREDIGFDAVAHRLGSKLRIVEQANLGGSGGFSRGMYETVQAARSDAVILLDDDIILEPESILRLTAFGQHAAQELIVGGHMFDMNRRSCLHTYGEIVDPFHWQPGLPGPDQSLGHDFAASNFRNTKWMHQRVDVDYNGWWMCMIPVSTIRKLGLSLPIFIKWDDVEYGLRAKEAGIPTVSLPGAALWHVSWADKDDLVGWQAYFHARNRLISALMYSPFTRPRTLLTFALALDLKHQTAMQYYTATGRLMALRDLVAGPEKLHHLLPTRLPEIRSMAKQFPDAVMRPSVEDFPEIRRRKPMKPSRKHVAEAGGFANRARIGLQCMARQILKPVDEMAQEHPQLRVAHKDNRWWNVARNDSALVSNADGTGMSWYKRDPRALRAMAAESTLLHARIAKEWPKLRETYRNARERLTSFEAWAETFRNNS